MEKLNKDIEMLQSALDMLRDTLKGINGLIDLKDLRDDSGYIKQRAEDIYTTIQETLEEADLNDYDQRFIG